MKKFNKKKLPSRHTSLGPDKAPQRSFYYAMNLTEKDLAKPGDSIVITAGVPFGNAGSTNLLRIAKIIDDNDLT